MGAENPEAAAESVFVPEIEPLNDPPRPTSLMSAPEAMPVAALEPGIEPLIDPPRPVSPTADAASTFEPEPRPRVEDAEPPASEPARDSDDERRFSILSNSAPIEEVPAIPSETLPQPGRWDGLGEAQEQARLGEAEDLAGRDTTDVVGGDASVSGSPAEAGANLTDAEPQQPVPEAGLAFGDETTDAELVPLSSDAPGAQEAVPLPEPPAPEVPADDGAAGTLVAVDQAATGDGPAAIGAGTEPTVPPGAETLVNEPVGDSAEQEPDAVPDGIGGGAEPNVGSVAAEVVESANDPVAEAAAAASAPESADAALDDGGAASAAGMGEAAVDSGAPTDIAASELAPATVAAGKPGDVPMPTLGSNLEDGGASAAPAATGLDALEPDTAGPDDRGLDGPGPDAATDVAATDVAATDVAATLAPVPATDAVSEEMAAPDDQEPGSEPVRGADEPGVDVVSGARTALSEPPADAPASETTEFASDVGSEADAAPFAQLPAVTGAEGGTVEDAEVEDARAGDAVAWDAVSEEAVAEDPLPRGAVAEDVVAEDAVPGAALAEDVVAEDAAPGDAAVEEAAVIEPRTAEREGEVAGPDLATEGAVEGGEQPDGPMPTTSEVSLDGEPPDGEPAAQAQDTELRSLGEEDGQTPADASMPGSGLVPARDEAPEGKDFSPDQTADAADMSVQSPEDSAGRETATTEPAGVTETTEPEATPEMSPAQGDQIPSTLGPASADGGASVPEPEPESDEGRGEASSAVSTDAAGDTSAEADDRERVPRSPETTPEDATEERRLADPTDEVARVDPGDAPVRDAERAGTGDGADGPDAQALDQDDWPDGSDGLEGSEAVYGTSQASDAIPDEAADDRITVDEDRDGGVEAGPDRTVDPDRTDDPARADRADEHDRSGIDAGIESRDATENSEAAQRPDERPADGDIEVGETDPPGAIDPVQPTAPDRDGTAIRESKPSEEDMAQERADRDDTREQERMAQEDRAKEQLDQERDGQADSEPASDKLERLERAQRELAQLNAERTERDPLEQDADAQTRLKAEAEALADLDQKRQDAERVAKEAQKSEEQEADRAALAGQVEESLLLKQPEPGRLDDQGRELKRLDDARRDQARLEDNRAARERLEEEGNRLETLDQERRKQERGEQDRLAQQERERVRSLEEQSEQARLRQERDDTVRREADEAARRHLAARTAAERTETEDARRGGAEEVRALDPEPAPTVAERRDGPDGGPPTAAPEALPSAERVLAEAEGIARAARSESVAREAEAGPSAEDAIRTGPQAAGVNGGGSGPRAAPGPGSAAPDASPPSQPVAVGAGVTAVPPGRPPPASSDEPPSEDWDDGPSARPPRGLSPITSEDPLPEATNLPDPRPEDGWRAAPPVRPELRQPERSTRPFDLDRLKEHYGRPIRTNFETLLDPRTTAEGAGPMPMKVDGGWLGELISRTWLNNVLGLQLTPLQNKSNQGADGIYIDHATKTVVLAEMKWSNKGAHAAEGVSERSPEDRIFDWAPARLEANSSWKAAWAETPGLYDELRKAMASGKYKVAGVHIRAGFATGDDGQRIQEFIIDDWPDTQTSSPSREEWKYSYTPTHTVLEPRGGQD